MNEIAHQPRRIDVDEGQLVAHHLLHAQLGSMGNHGRGGVGAIGHARFVDLGISIKQLVGHEPLGAIEDRLPRQEELVRIRHWKLHFSFYHGSHGFPHC